MEEYTLKNNLTILHESSKHRNTVDLSVHIKLGTRDEEELPAGTVHLLEHVVMNQTINEYKKHKLYKEYIENSLDAITYRDATVYEITCHKDDIKSALAFFEILFSIKSFSPTQLQNEKLVISDELKLEYSEDVNIAHYEYIKYLYNKGPYTNHILGNKKSLSQIHKKQLQNLYHKTYTGSNCILGISGDTSIGLIKKSFSKINKGTPLKTPTLATNKVPYATIDKKLSRGYFYVTYKCKADSPKEVATYRFIRRLIQNELYEGLRKKFGIYASGIYCYNHENTLFLSVEGGCLKQDLKEVTNYIQKFLSSYSKKLTSSTLKDLQHSAIIELELEEDNPYNTIKSTIYHKAHFPHQELFPINKEIILIKKLTLSNIKATLKEISSPTILHIK